MIKVVKETWHFEKGVQKIIYQFKENEKMKLVIDNNIYATQLSSFQTVKEDWNCDNDIYELFGAYFDMNGRNEFLTPEDIVFLIEDNNLKVIY